MAYPYSNASSLSSLVGGESAMMEDRVTDIPQVHDALSQASSLAARMEAIVGRLIGFEPEAVSGDRAKAGPDGVLPQLAFHARETLYDIAKARAALDRLESKL